MTTPLERYANPFVFSSLRVPQHAIINAALNLDMISALRLIRVAYQSDDGSEATLDAAKEIYNAILVSGVRPSHTLARREYVTQTEEA